LKVHWTFDVLLKSPVSKAKEREVSAPSWGAVGAALAGSGEPQQDAFRRRSLFLSHFRSISHEGLHCFLSGLRDQGFLRAE
jgi:hypothetical protein